MNHRHEKREDYMRDLAAEFISKESNRTSLITVVRLDMSTYQDNATIVISVMPENQEKAALDFLNRQLSEMREFIKSKIPSGKIPFFSIALDKGTKLARKIDELSNNS
jgi:ribosome-binding factor A